MKSVSDLLFGRPISTREDERERIGPARGVAVLGLDALASAAYGPEALLTVLLPLGVAGLRYVTPLTGLIVGILLLVALSYRQTIAAYPDGGGAYTVAKENLNTTASLFAAAALALDYTLNVAVAISAGIGALVSAVPRLLPHTLALCLAVLVALTILNLRGVRTTGLVFSFPTLLFLGSMFGVLGVGIAKIFLHGGHPVPVVGAVAAPATMSAAPAWLLMRAFANGCTAMTGIEAVSNATPIFRRPSVVAGRRTLTTIVVCLVVLLAGIAHLTKSYAITATPPGQAGYESVLSLVTAATIGRGPFYYVTMASVMAVLAFSANTSFADFPRVCRLLAVDHFLPEPLAHRGRRLTFSHGIVALAILSGMLLIVFRGVTDLLIPLFAVGALSAFTISQIGMVAHWRKQSGARAKRGLILNATGAVATGATLLVVLVSKFTEGAWISVTLVAGMLLLFRKVRAHHDFIRRATATSSSLALEPERASIAVVPMRRWDCVALKAMTFAIGMADEVIAVQVLTGDREVDDLTSRWNALAVEPSQREGRDPPKLVVLRSEYRQLYTPLLDFVTKLECENPSRPIAVIVAEVVEPRWYQQLLYTHTGSLMKEFLLFRGGPQTVIVNTPFYLDRWKPEQDRLRAGRPSSSIASWCRQRLSRAR